MFEFLARLQQKPEHERRAIAVVFSAGMTLIIFAIWASATFMNMGDGKIVVTQEDVAAQNTVAKAEASPLQSLKQSAAAVGSQLDVIKNFFGNFGKVQYDGK